MKKQTKLVAVLSTAALLAIGASMTSFAATGWAEEDGTWVYYDRNGDKVTDKWAKSGNNWYYLDSNGEMAVDQLIEDGDNYYYVDVNGVMAANQWVAIDNEDAGDDDEPEHYWYYFQANGKALKQGDSDKVSLKTVNGKKYAFDEDGKMLYGWVNEDDSTLASDDSDWETATYYMGSWEDGSLKTGWQKITVYDQDEDDDYDYWFNFKSNGKKRFNESDSKDIFEKKINGKHYAFDNRGVMTYEWTLTTTSDAATISNWLYFNSPEDGARATKGWFKVVAPDKDGDDNTFKDYSNLENPTFAKGDAEDENERWYYANSDGELYVGQIKKIKGKYYGFAPEGNKAGSMLTGLCALRVDNSGNITKLWARDMDSDDLDDAMNGEGDFDGFGSDTNDTLYYFGNNEDSDGALKTGSVSVNLDGDNYQFQFSKTGGAEGKGRGLNGIDDSKYIYKFGMKLKAGSDDKYIVVYADGDTGASDVTVHKIDTAALRRDAVERGQNKDGDTVYAYGTLGSLVSGKASSNYYLLNTSGTIVKNKTAAKDGNDWYFYVDEKVIKMYTNNNTLTGGVEDLKKDWNVESKLISDGIDGDVLDTDMVDDGI